MSVLVPGSNVPIFAALDQNNNTVSNESLLGSKYILFFYGQDDTPTCNKQVCTANDVWPEVKKHGYKMYGVSPDKLAKHQKFIDKFQLSIDLLSDPDKKMMYAFGAYGPKIFMGKEVIGVYRKAVFVDVRGKIEKVISDVVAAKQGELIKEGLDELKNK